MDCAYSRTVKTPDGYLEVPCGTCILCRIARTREWSTRLQYENSCWRESVFLTLTYDDEHIPLTGCCRPTLVKKDLQDFFKRLRSYLYDKVCDAHPELDPSDKDDRFQLREFSKIKYFACGEYGDRTQRCHFHAIIFGQSPSDIATFQKLWPFGFVSVGSVSPQSIQYVTGYVRKKVVKKSTDPKDFCCLKRAPEFQLQSQGLGLSFYEKQKEHIRSSGSCYINGHNESIPRYFLKKDNYLRLKLKASNLINNPRSENLKRAQEILNMRVKDKDIVMEMRLSALNKEKTERSKNVLFRKGTI